MHGPCVDIWHVGGGLSHLKIRSTNKTKKYRKKRKKNEMKRDEEKSKGKKKGHFWRRDGQRGRGSEGEEM